MTSRNYHHTDIANSGSIMAHFEPTTEAEQKALRYTMGAMQVPAVVCKSYFRQDDRTEFILIFNELKSKYYIVERWTESDEPHYKPMDTPLAYDERTLDGSDVVFQYIIPTEGLSQLSYEDRERNIPESSFSAGAIRAMAQNNIRGYKQYQFPTIWDLGYAEDEAGHAMIHERVRQFWADCNTQRQMERAQSLEAGRGTSAGFTSSALERAADALR